MGVVQDTKHNSLREPSAPFAFLPLRQPRSPERRVTLSVASVAPGGEAALLQPIRRRLAEVDPGMMISEVISIRRQIDATLLTERLLSGLATAFGALAMILASVGLYGVLSYRVGQQRQSIGIRMALGASPSSAALSVLRQSGKVIAVGTPLRPAVCLCGGAGGGFHAVGSEVERSRRSISWQPRCCVWWDSSAPGCPRDGRRP